MPADKKFEHETSKWQMPNNNFILKSTLCKHKETAIANRLKVESQHIMNIIEKTKVRRRS